MKLDFFYTTKGLICGYWPDRFTILNKSLRIVDQLSAAKNFGSPISYFTEHNETGPAQLRYDENTGNILGLKWCIYDTTNRQNKPAIFDFVDGNIERIAYFVNGESHNGIGPAIITFNKKNELKEERWIKNGKVHREDGPAIIMYDESGNIKNQRFFLNHIEYTYDNFIQAPEYQAYLKSQSIHIFD